MINVGKMALRRPATRILLTRSSPQIAFGTIPAADTVGTRL
jgi:hypothetical protein